MDNLKAVTQIMREVSNADSFDVPMILMKWLEKEQSKVRYEVLEQQKAYHNRIISEIQKDLYVSQQQYHELKKRYAEQYRKSQLTKEAVHELVRYA